MIPKGQSVKGQKMDFIEVNNFCFVTGTIKRIKSKLQTGRKHYIPKRYQVLMGLRSNWSSYTSSVGMQKGTASL